MSHITVLKQALDALERLKKTCSHAMSAHEYAGTHDAIEALRAAIAQLALSVGDSHFESWYSEYQKSGGSMKPQMRDAYAAGMGDPLVAIVQPDDYAVHAAHCDQDEYEGACKYGDDNCPIMAKQKATQPELVGYVPLTHEQIEEIWVEHGLDECDCHGFARAVERAMRGAK